jgi:hypothetical protein
MFSTADIRDAVRMFATSFDPALVDAATAAALVKDWAAIANMAETVVALAARRVAETAVWRETGSASAADWLAGVSGTTASHARETLATAERLSDLDDVATAARCGDLSPAQASAVSDAAAADPETESALLALARRQSLGELRDTCARTKAAADPDPEATHRRLRAARRLRRYRDCEGSEHLHAQGTAEDMALIDQALRPLIDARFAAARREGRQEPTEAYAFDALVDLARGAAAMVPAGKKPSPRYMAVLRLDWEAIIRGWVEDDETCEVAGLGSIPVSVARDLLGDSVMKLVITKGTGVVNVTHLGRGVNTAQQIALLWQMPMCTREGCPRRKRLENDHRVPWAELLETELRNIDPLCGPDHHLKTHEGWALVQGSGRRPMVPPGHPDHPRSVALRERPPPLEEAV